MLASTPGNGFIVSKLITPTTTFVNWNNLIFSHAADPPTTTLTVDVLNSVGQVVLADVTSGDDLSVLDPTQYPSLKLRANMASTAAGQTPTLASWQLAWQIEEHKVYLPVVMK
jgi:hypothetical protein